MSRPTTVAQGSELPVGSYHIKPVAGGYTVARMVGAVVGMPVVGHGDPQWKTWTTHDDATQWMDAQGPALCDFPLWGR